MNRPHPAPACVRAGALASAALALAATGLSARPLQLDSTAALDGPEYQEETPLSICFAADPPPDPAYRDAILAEFASQALPPPPGQATSVDAFNGGFFSWSSVGDPAVVTWSFVPDGLVIPGDGSPGPTEPSALFASMNAKFGGNTQAWIANVQSAFDRWEELCGLNFVRVTDGANEWDDGASWGAAGNDTTRGDIRIGARNIDGPFNVLAFAAFPTNGNMVFDVDENWTSGSTDRFMRNTFAHEIGHAIGLSHVCPGNGTKLMEPGLSTAFDGPQHDDVRGALFGYGDAFEDNDTAATGAALGPLAPGVHTFGAVPGLPLPSSSVIALESTDQKDWYLFRVEQPSLVTVSAIPEGFSYDSSGQDSFSGGCFSGNFIDSEAVLDLVVQVRGPAPDDLLGKSDRSVIGLTETLFDVLLTAAGRYYVRITDDVDTGQSQMYTLEIEVEDCTGAGASDCNGNGVDDACEIQSEFAADFNANGVPDDCEPLSVDRDELSLANGGTLSFTLSAGPAYADELYWVFGSTAGTAPGIDLDGGNNLPLNFDGPSGYFLLSVNQPNVPPFGNTFGSLDGSGTGTASFTLPPASDPSLAGLVLDHAYAVVDGALSDLFTSNPMSLTLKP